LHSEFRILPLPVRTVYCGAFDSGIHLDMLVLCSWMPWTYLITPLRPTY